MWLAEVRKKKKQKRKVFFPLDGIYESKKTNYL